MSESSIRDVVIILYLHELAKTSVQVTLMEQQEIKRGDLTGTGGGLLSPVIAILWLRRMHL